MGWSLEMEEGSRGQGWKGPISPPSCPTSPFHIGSSMTQGWEQKPAPKGSEVDSYLGTEVVLAATAVLARALGARLAGFVGGFSDPVAPEDRPETPSQGCHARARGPLFLF